jgi:hypothetical protein
MGTTIGTEGADPDHFEAFLEKAQPVVGERVAVPSVGRYRLPQDRPELGRFDFAWVAEVDLVVLADHCEAVIRNELLVHLP